MIAPKFPSTNSLEGFALCYFLTGRRISHLSFQGDTNSYCLRSPVCNLRAAGWPIEDCWNAGAVSRFSKRRTRFKKYFIADENISALQLHFGERLKKFIEAVQRIDAEAA
jgi:hypothetical protein